MPSTKLGIEIRVYCADEHVREVLKAWFNLKGPQSSLQDETMGYPDLTEDVKTTYCPMHSHV